MSAGEHFLSLGEGCLERAVRGPGRAPVVAGGPSHHDAAFPFAIRRRVPAAEDAGGPCRTLAAACGAGGLLGIVRRTAGPRLPSPSTAGQELCW